MTFFAAIRAFFSALAAAFGFARDKRLMDAGAAESDAKSLAEAQHAAARAARARDSVRDDPGDILRDPDNRDSRS